MHGVGEEPAFFLIAREGLSSVRYLLWRRWCGTIKALFVRCVLLICCGHPTEDGSMKTGEQSSHYRDVDINEKGTAGQTALNP